MYSMNRFSASPTARRIKSSSKEPSLTLNQKAPPHLADEQCSFGSGSGVEYLAGESGGDESRATSRKSATMFGTGWGRMKFLKPKSYQQRPLGLVRRRSRANGLLHFRPDALFAATRRLLIAQRPKFPETQSNPAASSG
jgi:hypothetical protein